MANAWIDDDLYREPWTRSMGPVAMHVYLAATNLIHREARGEPFLTRQELRDAYPWDISDDELEQSIQRLVGRDRFVVSGDLIELPLYQYEQEDNAKRRDRKAINAANAAKAMKHRERDETGRLVPKSPGSNQRVAGSIQRNGTSPLERPASGPIRSYPVRPVRVPPSAGPGPSAPTEPPPPEKPPKELTDPQKAWEHYVRRYAERENGAKPTRLEQHFINFTRLVKAHGLAEVCRRIDVYFDAPPFSLHDGSRDLKRFFNAFDQLASAARGPPGSASNGFTADDPFNVERIAKRLGVDPCS